MAAAKIAVETASRRRDASGTAPSCAGRPLRHRDLERLGAGERVLLERRDRLRLLECVPAELELLGVAARRLLAEAGRGDDHRRLIGDVGHERPALDRRLVDVEIASACPRRGGGGRARAGARVARARGRRSQREHKERVCQDRARQALVPAATIVRPADAGVFPTCRTSDNKRSAFARPPASGSRTCGGARPRRRSCAGCARQSTRATRPAVDQRYKELVQLAGQGRVARRAPQEHRRPPQGAGRPRPRGRVRQGLLDRPLAPSRHVDERTLELEVRGRAASRPSTPRRARRGGRSHPTAPRARSSRAWRERLLRGERMHLQLSRRVARADALIGEASAAAHLADVARRAWRRGGRARPSAAGRIARAATPPRRGRRRRRGSPTRR